jgi:hypothetical protein
MKNLFARLLKTPNERAAAVLAKIETVTAKCDRTDKWWHDLRDAANAAEVEAASSLDVDALNRAADLRAKFTAADPIYLRLQACRRDRIVEAAREHREEIVDLLQHADRALLTKQNRIRDEHAKQLADEGATGVAGEPPLVTAIARTRTILNSYLDAARQGGDLENALRWLVANCA